MATRNISAVVKIGAVMASNVKTVFGGLNKYIDGLGSNLAKVKKASSDIARLQAAQARLTKTQASGNAASIAKQQAAVDRLTASLRKQGVDTSRLTNEQERLNAALARGQTRMAGFTRLNSSIGKLGASFANARAQLGGLTTKIAALSVGAGYVFKTQFIDSAAAFEKYRIQLRAFGDDSEKALSWSEQFAMQTPLNLDEVVRAYVRLRQQGLDPTDGTLQALVDSVAKVGGEFYDLEEIINQLGQAFRKEKLTAEDVKPLINRGVPVYEMLSKALGKSAKEIMKMQEKGELGKDAIKGLLFELGRWSKGMSKEMAGTWSGILGRMGDYWVKFTKTVMESGPFKVLKAQLESFLDTLETMEKDGVLKQWAEETGKAITDAIYAFRDFAVEAWGAIKAVKDFVGGWKNFGIVLAGVALAPTILSVVQLGIAIGGVLGPWGLLAAAVISAGVALYTWRNEIKKWLDQQPVWLSGILKFFSPLGTLIVYWDDVTASVLKFKEGISSSIDWAISKINGLMEAMKSLSSMSIGGASLGGITSGLLDVNPITGPARLIGRGVEKLMMPAENMPTQRGGSITNNVDVKIDARGSNGLDIAEKLRGALSNRPLFDQTSVLAPQ